MMDHEHNSSIGSEQSEEPNHLLQDWNGMLLLDGEDFLTDPKLQEQYRFRYTPGTGVEITGPNSSALTFAPTDRVALRGKLGELTIAQVFGAHAEECTGAEFVKMLEEEAVDLKTRVEKIQYLVEAAGGTFGAGSVLKIIESLRSDAPHYSPQDLIAKILTVADKKYAVAQPDEVTVPSEYFLRLGIIDYNPLKFDYAVVDYFYWWGKLAGYRLSDFDDSMKAIKNFKYRDELLSEYRRKGDGRFGDSVLSACFETVQAQGSK